MTIHWKAVERYFTVVLFVNPLTPRVKPWVIQSFLIFDNNCDHSFESCTLLWCCLFFNFTKFLIMENLSVLDLVLSGMKGLTRSSLGYVGTIVIWQPQRTTMLELWRDGSTDFPCLLQVLARFISCEYPRDRNILRGQREM